jgi:hypothetical protein
MGDSRTNWWQPHEDEVLRANAGLHSGQLVPLLPGRTSQGIKERRRKLGVAWVSSTWTPEAIARLRQLVTIEKRTAEATSKLMGITRNAVIGQCHRLGIKLPNQQYGSPGQRKAATKLNQERKAKSTASKRGSAKHPDGKNNNPTGWTGRQGKPKGPDGLPALLPSRARVSILDLGYRHCRYIGERPDLVTIDSPIYCGAATDGGSWCPAHRAGVFRLDRPKTLLMGLAKLR